MFQAKSSYMQSPAPLVKKNIVHETSSKMSLQVSQCNNCPAKKTSCSWTESYANVCAFLAGYTLRALESLRLE